MKLFIKKSKFIFILIFSIVFAICISISLQSLYAWSPPNNVPPICNSGEPGCDAPLHVGTSTQSKIGALIISRDPSNKNVLGLQVENGPVGIGMIFPQTPNSNSLLHLYRVIGGEPNAEIDIQSVSGANNHWGIYQDRTTSDLRFWGTGNDLVTFANEGKVGIGTSTPSAKFSVKGSGVATGRLLALSDSANVERMTVLDNGNTAIGTVVDTVAKLTIGGKIKITDTTAGENPELQLQYGVNDSNHWSFFVDKVDSNKLKIWNANNLFTINSAGNVGIGTTGPGAKLDVSGSAIISGTGTALTLSGAATTAINISNTGVTTDINLQNGETIDNDTDGRIKFIGDTLVSGNTYFANGTTYYVNTSGNLLANQITANAKYGYNYSQWAYSAGAATSDLFAYAGNMPSYDVFEYAPVVSVEYNNGSWTTWSSSNMERAFDHNVTTSATVDATHQNFRFVIDMGAWACPSLYEIERSYAASSPNYTITIETDDNTGFTSPTSIYSGSALASKEMFSVAASTCNADRYVRFTVTANQPFTLNEISALSTRAGSSGVILQAFQQDYSSPYVTSGLAVGYSSGQTVPSNGLVVSGNVGIGTTNPGYKLTIVGNSPGAGTGVLGLRTPGSAQGERSSISMYSTFQGTGDNGPRRTADIIAGFNGGAWGNEYLAFSVGSAGDGQSVTAEKMRIQSNGNVGIGTASPGAKLEVAGQIKITGGSPGANKVLTSDADGLASWAVAPGSDSLPGGTDDQTMRWNNGAWEANSLLKVDDGGAVTITSSYDNPSARARYIFLRDSTNANLYSYIGINRNSAAGANKEYLSIEGVEETVHWLNIILGGEGGGRVGIGTKSPTNKMTVLVPNANDGVSFTDGTRWTLMAPGTVAAGSYNPIVGANDNSIIYTAGVINTGSFVIAPWSSGTASGIKIDSSGNVGIGTTTPSAKFSITGNGTGTGRLMALANSSNSDIFTVLDNGNVNIKGTVTAGAGDVAEEFSANEYLEVGTVLVMGNNGFKYARSCDKKYDQTVIGVVSENPSLLMGNVDTKYKVSVAINGVVKVKVNNKNGKIYKGDMITTSDISGQAMKATYNKLGTIIGKALENLDEDSGEIMVLVNLN